MQVTASGPLPAPGAPWRRVMSWRVGPLPAPLYIAASAVVVLAAVYKCLPNDLIGGLALLMLAGSLLGEIGARAPILKHIGGTAILCLLVPSALVGYRLVDPDILKTVATAMKTANLQYLYIAALVVGSIFGMSHKVLVQGFTRMFVPLAVGTLAGAVVGIGVGALFGLSPKHTFFFIIVPIVGGGIGEGVLPLSIAYAEILGKTQGELIATMIPAALIGNVVAILSSGLFHWLGEKRPELSGNGSLVRTGGDRALLEKAHDRPLDLKLMGTGLLLTCTFFILGALLSPVTGIPGPVLMIVSVAVIKVSRLMPASVELGAYQLYKFMTTNLTFAILVGLGTLFVAWNQMVASLTLGYFMVCLMTVLAIVVSGFVVGRLMKMYPVESAIVTACHSGLGGTGDVAILSASNRMELMPFAQISTRIGGAAMVVLATLLLKAVA